MEITLENIFQLFAESEKQRAAERAEYERQRESERQERFEQRAAELKQREIDRIEYEKQRAAEAQQRAAEAQQRAAEAQQRAAEAQLRAAELVELEKKRAVELAEIEKKRAAELAEIEKKRVADLAEIEKQREIRRIAAEKKEEQKRAEDKLALEAELKQRSIAADKEFKKFSRELSKRMGDLSNVLGLYAEAQTKERIREMFGERGIELRSMTTHYLEEDGKGGFLYEIDILLYNTLYAIVVEVKNHLKKDDIDTHIERLDKCVSSPPRGTEGKILLGAVATMIVSQEVETYAKRQGFYVIKPSGKSVKIANDAQFKHKEWQTEKMR